MKRMVTDAIQLCAATSYLSPFQMQQWNNPWRGNNSQKHNAVNTFEKSMLHCFARKIITQLKWSVSLESDLMLLEIETWMPSGPRNTPVKYYPNANSSSL